MLVLVYRLYLVVIIVLIFSRINRNIHHSPFVVLASLWSAVWSPFCHHWNAVVPRVVVQEEWVVQNSTVLMSDSWRLFNLKASRLGWPSWLLFPPVPLIFIDSSLKGSSCSIFQFFPQLFLPLISVAFLSVVIVISSVSGIKSVHNELLFDIIGQWLCFSVPGSLAPGHCSVNSICLNGWWPW